jgi:hypothetical protein
MEFFAQAVGIVAMFFFIFSYQQKTRRGFTIESVVVAQRRIATKKGSPLRACIKQNTMKNYY